MIQGAQISLRGYLAVLLLSSAFILGAGLWYAHHSSQLTDDEFERAKTAVPNFVMRP